TNFRAQVTITDPAGQATELAYRGSLALNGSGYVDTGYKLSTTPSQRATTFEAWIFPTAGPSGTQRFVFDTAGSDGQGWALFYQEVWTIDTGSSQFTPGVPVTLNTWQHIAVVFDTQSNQVKMYINGVAAGSTNPITVPSSVGTLNIGSDFGGRNSFVGNIDEFRVWNRALTAAEVAKLDDGPVPDNSPDLAGWWSFNEGFGSVSKDRSPLANDARVRLLIAPISANASSSGTSASNTRNGSGLTIRTPIENSTHTNGFPAGGGSNTFWHTGTGVDGNTFIEWDLGANFELSEMLVWQFNAVFTGGDETNRGVKQYDLFAGSSPNPTTQIITDAQLSKAGGTDAEPAQRISLNGLAEGVRYVRMKIDSNYGGPFAGLSEVRFLGKPNLWSSSTPPVYVTTNYTLVDNGTYTLSATFSDPDGASDSVRSTFVVNNVAPTISSLNLGNLPVELGRLMTFTPTISDPGSRDTFAYLWSVTANNGQSILNSEQRNFSFVPTFAGQYIVRLDVTDSDGASSSLQQFVSVVPNVTINPTVGALQTGDVVTLTSTASALAPAATGATRLYAWTVQLNAVTVATGTTANVSFVPTAPGNYTASLTVSDVLSGIPRSRTANASFTVASAPTVVIVAENDISAPDFDGVNDSISLGVIPQPPTNNFSVAAWIKPDSFGFRPSIIGAPNWSLIVESTTLRLAKDNANFADFFVPANLPIGVWSHVAATMRPNGPTTLVEFFVNGVSIGVVNASAMNTDPGTTFIGSSRSGTFSFFDGMIREVGIWSTALTASQINEVRAGNFADTNPLQFWRLNDSAGTTINSTPSGFPGTLNNGLGWANQTMAVEGDILTFTLDRLSAVSELGTRVVVWSVSPSTFVVIPTSDPEMFRIRVTADGFYTVNATITDTTTSARTIATPIVVTESNSSVLPVAAGDLIAGKTPVITNGPIQSVEGGSTNPMVLTDGAFGLARTAQPYPDAIEVTPNLTLTYNLDLATNPNGYDITAINTYTGWKDPGRDDQNYIVLVSTVLNPTVFVNLSTINFVPAANTPSASSVSIGGGVLASSVAAVRFQFINPENGYVGYRELDVIGTPTAIAPVTFVRVADRNYVTAVNTAASVVADDVTGFENAPVTVSARVTDPGVSDTHTFSIVWSDGSANSTGTVTGGLVSVNKTIAQDGTYTGSLTVTDNAGAQSVKPISIVIANRAPTANNDTGLSTTENSSLSIAASSMLGNDTDPSPSDTLAIASVSGTSTLGASVVLNANGTVTYNPNSSVSLNATRSGFSQIDTFIYSITDTAGAISTATVSITVNGQNDLPIAVADSGAIVEDASSATVTGNLLANDTDPDSGTTLAIASVNGGAATTVPGLFGSLVWNENGTYTYTLNNSLPAVQQLAVGQSLVETFAYTLSDGVVSIVASSLTIRINGVNDAPIAAPNSNSVTAGSVIRIESGKYDDAILVDTPVAYWRLNESAGTVTANRIAPSTPDGTIIGPIGYSAGGLLANSPDFGLAFTGTQSITVPNSTLINTSSNGAKTIELWFNASNVQPRQVIYQQGDSTSGLNLYVDAGQLYFGTWNAGVFGPTVKSNITSNTTYHVVGVFGASTATLYVNGVQVATGGTSGSIAPQAGITSIGGAVSTRFHGNTTATSGNNFTGTIDEVAVYNTALTAAQIGMHYAATGLLAGDTDVDTGDTRTVTAINGVASRVGSQFELPSGALLTVQSDGTYDYDPNGAFDHLNASGSGTDSFAYTIADSNGSTSTATVTITVQGRNDAPTGISLSNELVTLSNTVATLSTMDVDLADLHTYTIVNQTVNAFAIQDGTRLVVSDRTGLVLGEPQFLTIDAIDTAGAMIRQTFELLVTEIPAAVGVISTQVSPSSVRFQFNTAIDLSVLNLYDGVDASVDAADITIVGATTGAVKGSILWDATTNALTFVKTGSPLVADTYTATLFSRADGFKSSTGELLDGDSNGTPGGNFVTTFGVTTTTARVVSVPDFARGATSSDGQVLNLLYDNGLAGLPVSISEANDVTSVDFDVVYNSAMLNFSSTMTSFSALPAGWSTAVSHEAGVMHVTIFGASPLGPGPRDLTRLLGRVPNNAPYGASDLVRIENLRVFTQTGGGIAVPSIADSGLHKAIFIGDTNADGQYTAQDAGYLAGVRVGNFSGFDAHAWADPIIVADVTQSGALEGQDSSWMARKALLSTLQPEIPNLPAGSINVLPGIDPTIAVDANVLTRRGATVNVPVRITDDAAGLFGVDVFVDYDTSVLDLISGLNLSGVNVAGIFLSEAGWTIDSFVDDAMGKVRVAMYRAAPSSSTSGVIANIPFVVKPNAPFGVSPLIANGYANVPPFSFSFVNGSVIVVNQQPTDITLNQNTVLENTSTAAADLLFGQLGTVDLDPVDSYIYDLVSGSGDTDNARFNIVADQVFIKQGQ
ncbi:MAG: LamG-like jellyroll fold domain-containing protein, partial [Pirellula sp.]